MSKQILLIGMIKRHPDGFGFFIPEDPTHEDVYIPRQSMNGVMTNDKVRVEVFRERGGDRYRGEVVGIIERGTKNIVGRFFKLNSTMGVVRDEGKAWGEDLKVKLSDCPDVKDKDLVSATIIDYPGGEKPFFGIIAKVIGDALEPLNDIPRILAINNIPVEFSKATLEEAKSFKEVPDPKDYAQRKDLRHLDLITIDGATAKDFDDAVYVENNDTGFKLYVAIADVSHYVRVGSAIDKDAYERGTSVYFPNYVVPMLPEVLSNGLCSLNPHVPRLCMVAEMQMDFTGQMMSSSFYEAVMESKARVTYGEAQEVIDGIEVEKLKHVREGILRLADLAKILMARRFKEGSLDLEIPETELVIDGSGIPVDIIKSKRLFSHRLIEEMMLAANVAVAKFLSSKEIHALYRIHEPPNDMAIRLLEKYLKTFGGKVKLESGKLQKRLTKALEEFAGKPESQALNVLTLRSMSQAKYSMENVGHFGLGFEFYTHFTSPIRRYPDLIVHRLLKNQSIKNSQYRLMAEDELMTAATILSAAEQRSVKAERQVQSIKKARFIEKHLGEELDGMITSVAKFGAFVLLREYDIDGLVRCEELSPNEKLIFDEENLKLIAKRSGHSFSIGDSLRIQVAAVDIEAGQISFVLPADPDKKFENRKKEKSSPEQKQKPDDNTRDRTHKQRPLIIEDRSQSSSKNDRHHSRRQDERKQNDRPQSHSKNETRDNRPNKQDFSRKNEKQSRFDNSANKRSSQASFQEPKTRTIEITPRQEDSGPNEDLLKMILGPDEYQRVMREKQDKPKLSKKLQFAEKSNLRFNSNSETEKSRDTAENSKPHRKNTEKRKSSEGDRGSVRKTRVSQSRRTRKTR